MKNNEKAATLTAKEKTYYCVAGELTKVFRTDDFSAAVSVYKRYAKIRPLYIDRSDGITLVDFSYDNDMIVRKRNFTKREREIWKAVMQQW